MGLYYKPRFERSGCGLKSWISSQFLTPLFLLSKLYVVNRIIWGYYFIDGPLLEKTPCILIYISQMGQILSKVVFQTLCTTKSLELDKR